MWTKEKRRCPYIRIIQIMSGLILSFSQSLNLSFATERCIAVYYPDVNRPYDAVFKQMLSGIEQTADMPINRYLVYQTEQSPSEYLKKNRNNCGTIIGLGRGGLKVALKAEVPTVVGAVIMQPNEIENLSGVSLIPQPKAMFKRLKHFVPSIESVFVVYNPQNNDQVIDRATRAAKQMRLKLHAIEAVDLRSAFAKYKDIMDTIDTKKSALWFLHDPATVSSRTILPFVLKWAWDKKIAVFSSQAGHAKNGVLFSVYPDNVALGKRLGELALGCATSGCPTKNLSLLSDLLTAVNTRMAARLGIRLNTRRDPFVNIIFPHR